MNRLQLLKAALAGSASVVTLAQPAAAKLFNIPDGDLSTALVAYMKQSDIAIIYADTVVRGRKSHGAKGDYSETAALDQILRGTGLTTQTMPMNAISIVPERKKSSEVTASSIKVAAAIPRSPAPGAIETVVVTAQKKTENIQNVPIAVTALSQAQLTERQIAGGPDLIKEVPNLTFSKTNFSGYNLEIRGIGTQAISVTTDPAVAVAFNDIPFIRNHFFEQEFYDLADVEVLRGPQGTLYGRNATAGVVNIKSALPDDQYEAMLSADMGNYSNRRVEGMINLPIAGDTLDLRVAGEWTKRDGYDTDAILNTSIDGRDLWSGRVTLGWKPEPNVQTYLVWEHFSEDDDRLRSGKQLCKTAPIPTYVDGAFAGFGGSYGDLANFLSQGCEDTSLYSPDAFEVPNGFSLAYGTTLAAGGVPILTPFDVYASTTQSTDLRDVEAAVLPRYRAKNDTIEYNANWTISPSLTLTSQTGYNNDFLWSTEDYDRFDSAPGIFTVDPPYTQPDPSGLQICTARYSACGPGNSIPFGSPCPTTGSTLGAGCELAGEFCDPQLGCSDRLVLQDLSTERSWQIGQEFRLASNFSGPVNFNFGANVLHYETDEQYYVFVNTLSLFKAIESGSPAPWVPGVTDNVQCLGGGYRYTNYSQTPLLPDVQQCSYIDPNPLTGLNGEGHNYFLSNNPYVLNSYAAFGEVYYEVTDDLKLTTGLRFTDDQKHFDIIPSELLIPGYGYPETGQTNQTWSQFTGREVLDWTPDLDFTDRSLFYASYSHGYKAGGANPPGALLGTVGEATDVGVLSPIHPLTFKPEFVEAFELGSKNTLLSNTLTINGDIFYYNYSNYQISEIVDRTAINNNYNAHVEGAELETNWEPLPGFKLNWAQGFEATSLAGGDEGIDLMDRTAGTPGWMVVKPYVSIASNCILPTYVVAAALEQGGSQPGFSLCSNAYVAHIDPLSGYPFPSGYPGFNPLTAPNNGEGFDKHLGGNPLPNAPRFTSSFTAEYTIPVSEDWAATLHGDFYWQSQSWARVFDDAIDKIHGYSTTNVSLILSSANGWQVMGYVKNVFNVTAITGTFLNSDDTGLTTNVFLTDPRLFGVRVTKQLDQNDGFWGTDYSGYDLFTNLSSDTDNGPPPLWIELGGQLTQLDNPQQPLALPFTPSYAGGKSPMQAEEPLRLGFDEDASVAFQPDGDDWVFSGKVQFGRTGAFRHQHLQTPNKIIDEAAFTAYSYHFPATKLYPSRHVKFADTQTHQTETHAIMDFEVGKDVGLGALGLPGSSSLEGGLRIAQFVSKSSLSLHAEPDVQYPTAPISTFDQKYEFANSKIRFHDYAQNAMRKESFHAFGPKIDWNANTPVAGNDTGGEITFDWGAGLAVLFGRQKLTEQHQSVVKSYYLTHRELGFAKIPGIRPIVFTNSAASCGNPPNCHPTNQHTNSGNHKRSRMVAVPNIGGFAGLSWKYQNAKVSFGYRADEFFGAMDGGIDTYKSENRGFFGPYANVSIGLGG